MKRTYHKNTFLSKFFYNFLFLDQSYIKIVFTHCLKMHNPIKQPKKVANLQKNFIYECEICYQDYDNKQHMPMIICSNYHAICLNCVKSNLFKMEYNQKKNPTGRYMCSKCSQIINKDFIREHNILKEVCNYIRTIREKDQAARKDFYNYVGSMGMNLVAMREDFDTIEKNNILLKKQNEMLVKENCKIRDEFARIEKASGSLEELQKISRKVQQMKETLQFQKVKLQSINEQIKRRNDQIQQKRDEMLKQNKRFFQLQAELREKREELKQASRKSLQLIEQNEGAINLKEYIEQEINNLQNQKKSLILQNTTKKRKMNQGIKKMQQYWENLLISNLEDDKRQKEMIAQRKQQKKVDPKKDQIKKEHKSQQNIKMNFSKSLPKKKEEIQQKVEKQQSVKIITSFDQSQKSIKNFYIQDNNVTLTNSKLSTFTHICFENPFVLNADHSFTIKIKRLSSQQIMIGLMTPQCKNKKNIYNRNGFCGFDGWSTMWFDGNTNACKLKIKQGDQVKVTYNNEMHAIVWEKWGDNCKEYHKLPQAMKGKNLYPVVLLIQDEDSFEVLQCN